MAGPFDLDGRGAVVTGGSSGIGQAICVALARAGANVAVLDVAEADETGRLVQAEGRGFLFVETDTGDRGQVEAAAAQAEERFGVAIWVNNAARMLVKPIVETSDEDWHTLLGPNLHGYFYGCRAAARLMRDSGFGRIVNVTSAAGILAVPDLGAYTAAKGAILALTKVLALELADAGVTVNAVAPGAVDTPLNEDAYTDEVRRTYEERIPAGRIGRPEDVGGAVVFLASDAAAYVTGQELVVDGGLTVNGEVGHARD